MQQAEPSDKETPEASGPSEGRDPVWDSRPRLRHDVLFADTGSGVLLRHADASFVVKGRGAYRFFSALAPYFMGRVTVAELADAIPRQQRPMLLSLVGTLLDRGFARDSRPAPEGMLDPEVKAGFQRQIDYVEHYVDGAAERFARFRGLRVLVAGDGPIAGRTALGLLRNGAGSIDMAGGDGITNTLLDEADRSKAQGRPVELRTVDLSPATMTGADLSGYDLVLMASDERSLPQVWRLCADADAPPLLPAVVLGEHVVVGPLNTHGTDSCWNCFLLRYTEAADAKVAARIWRRFQVDGEHPASTRIHEPQTAMVGNSLAFEAFRWATGVLEGETLEAALVQDLRTLDSASERVLPHPSCPDRHGADASVDLPWTGLDVEPEDDDSVSEAYLAAEAMVGARLGIIQDHLDLDLTQSPLKVSRVGFAGHDGNGSKIARADVHTTLRARLRTMRAAALGYVRSNATVHTGSDSVAGEPVRLDADRIGTAIGASGPLPDAPFTRGLCLVDHAVREVPVAAVHPFSAFNADGAFERTVGGEGVGSTAGYASTAALFSAGAFDALREAASGRPVTRIDPSRPPVGSELEFLTGVAATMGMEVRLLRPAGPVPTVIARHEEGTDWALGFGASTKEAATAALRDLIALEQLVEHGVPPHEVADTWLEAFDPRSLVLDTDSPAEPPDDARTTADQVCKALAEDGRNAVVVRTGTPDLERCGIHTAKVLFTVPSKTTSADGNA